MTRTIAVWLPDWPVTALLRTRDPARPTQDEAGEAASAPPLALLHAQRVTACSPAARAAGVRRGQRRRDAQSACPALRLVAADPGRDERAFLPVLRLLDERTPGVHPLRPGLVALRARGPARFYGGEQAACELLRHTLAEAGLTEVRVGVADGVFTAEQAARNTRADDPIRLVAPGASAAFLAPLPVSALADSGLESLLPRLGVHTLGDFAALDTTLLRGRLGGEGVRLQDLARGADSRRVSPVPPPPELARETDFDAPLDRDEQIAFASRLTAEAFCEALADAALVCTEVRITLVDDHGSRSERVWLHPTRFDPVSLIDRVRWQLQADPEALGSGIVQVRFEPEAVDDSAHHQPTLLGAGSSERLHHALSRVQAMLGHRGVLSPVLGGGRWLAERDRRIPWGDGSRHPLDRAAPWPGALPDPLPSEVFRRRLPTRVTAADGSPITVDERGLLTAAPALLEGRALHAWAGPWPVCERGWDARRGRSAHRFQLVDAAEQAWLVVLENDAWWIEGRYR